MITETIEDVELRRIPRTATFDFFITGLPRSRMAWIANYLSYDNMLCHFEAFREGFERGPDSVYDLANTAGVVGIADCGVLLFQDKLIQENPNAKWIIVERPQGEVVKSFGRLGVPVDQRLTNLYYKIGELKLKTDAFIVPFEQIDTLISVIAQHINPGWVCPQSRHDMLLGLNVQSTATVEDLEKIPAVNALSRVSERPVPTDTQKAYFELLREICGGLGNSYRWLTQAIQSATIMDHVTDGDLMDFTLFEETMKGILLEWGLNEFFIQNSRYLLPVMSAAMSAWQHTPEEMKRIKAYDIYSELPCAVAFLRGGQPLVDEVSPKVRQLVAQLMKEDDKRDS